MCVRYCVVLIVFELTPQLSSLMSHHLLAEVLSAAAKIKHYSCINRDDAAWNDSISSF